MYQTLAKINGTYRDSTKDPSTTTLLFVKEVKNWATEKLIRRKINGACERKVPQQMAILVGCVKRRIDVWVLISHKYGYLLLATINLYKNAIKCDDFRCQIIQYKLHYSNLEPDNILGRNLLFDWSSTVLDRFVYY